MVSPGIPPAATPPAATHPGDPRQVRNRRALAGLVVANAGLLLLGLSGGIFFFVSFPLGLFGLVLAADARGRVARGETTQRRNTAVTGMIAGVIALLLSSFAAMYWFGRFLTGD